MQTCFGLCSKQLIDGTREHFDYNIASLTGIVIVQFLPAAMTTVTIEGMSPALSQSCIANLSQKDMAKQLLTHFRFIARMNFSLKNYSCELFNLTGRSGKSNSFQLLQQLFSKAGM